MLKECQCSGEPEVRLSRFRVLAGSTCLHDSDAGLANHLENVGGRIRNRPTQRSGKRTPAHNQEEERPQNTRHNSLPRSTLPSRSGKGDDHDYDSSTATD